MMTHILSLAELSVWKADAETEVPSEGSEICPLETPASHRSDALLSDVDGTPRPRERIAGVTAVGDPGASSCPSRLHNCLDSAVHVPLPLSDVPAEHLWMTSSREQRSSSGALKALFLDYDGTLREFEERPELAVPTPDLHKLLAALNARRDLLVHIISGRNAEFLTSQLGRYGRFVLIAEHERRVAGRFQLWRPHADAEWPPSAVTAGSTECWRVPVRSEFSRACGQHAHSYIEEKASALVWHFRGVLDETVDDAAIAVARRLEKKMRKNKRWREVKVHLGSKTVEVSCRSVSKGDVVRRICDSRAKVGRPFESILIAGDDVSDESMFDTVATDDASTLSVKVGYEYTRARYYVKNPEELRTFLWRLVS